jgi:hypothetical protein
MPVSGLEFLTRQFEMAWKLTSYHLNGLSTEECLWRPASRGPHIHQERDDSWRADWPEREDYAAGPASIGRSAGPRQQL